MRISYVTTYDAADISNWSGLGHYIAKALEQQGIDITFIGPLKEYDDSLMKAKRILHRYVTRKNYQESREVKVLKYYAEQIKKTLKNMDVDIVFSPGTLPLCYLECNEPKVFWTDATYAGMVNFYPNWLNISRSSLRVGNRMEQAALSRCQLAIYSSDWAAETAYNSYNVDSAKIKVVPFGANIECNRTIEDIRAAINKRSQNICRLLFLGVHWYRKGGDIAVRVAEELNKRGLLTELCIVGCKPPVDVPDFVSVKGFISKATQQGRNTLEGILAEAHFLLMPSRAECCPVVIAEANSFGVPAVASNIGGIPTAVRNGKNGVVLPLESFVEQACSVILKSLSNGTLYREMAESSFKEYETRLNWGVAGRTVKGLLEEIAR